MVPFEVGDTVRAIGNYFGTNTKLYKDEEYKVLKILPGNQRILVDLKDRGGGWRFENFELVTNPLPSLADIGLEN